MFRNRKDAGEKLAEALEKYRAENPIILAIPRGGVEVGLQVAKRLNADFSLIITRKLPFPDNPEAGFGAIAGTEAHLFLKMRTIGLQEKPLKRLKNSRLVRLIGA